MRGEELDEVADTGSWRKSFFLQVFLQDVSGLSQHGLTQTLWSCSLQGGGWVHSSGKMEKKEIKKGLIISLSLSSVLF